jgi:hypothetical protein
MDGKISLSLIWLASMAAINSSVLVALPAKSVAQTLPDLPVAVMCWNASGQEWRVGYLSQVSKDGVATYLSPGGQLSITVNAKRTVEPPQDRGGVADCHNKTVDELRRMGRVVDIQRAQ